MAVGEPGTAGQEDDVEGCRVTSASDRLITGLVEDLQPVQRLPRLRLAFALILAVWAALLGLVLWAHEGELGMRSLFVDRIYLASFLGLVMASLGATVSALAAGIPGRERLEIAGMLLALLGLSSAAVACLLGMNEMSLTVPPAPEGVDAMCFRQGALLSLLPAGVILSFLVRGWATHPVRAAMVALLGSGALGVLIVHVSCGYLEPRHFLVSHLSVPIVLVVLGLYPLVIVLRRLRG